ALPLDLPFDDDRPRLGAKTLGELGRRSLVGSELVEIIVGRDGFVERLGFVGAKRASDHVWQLPSLGSGGQRLDRRHEGASDSRGEAADAGLDELAATQ